MVCVQSLLYVQESSVQLTSSEGKPEKLEPGSTVANLNLDHFTMAQALATKMYLKAGTANCALRAENDAQQTKIRELQSNFELQETSRQAASRRWAQERKLWESERQALRTEKSALEKEKSVLESEKIALQSMCSTQSTSPKAKQEKEPAAEKAATHAPTLITPEKEVKATHVERRSPGDPLNKQGAIARMLDQKYKTTLAELRTSKLSHKRKLDDLQEDRAKDE